MAISGRLNTVFCYSTPSITLSGDQTQYVYNCADSCFEQTEIPCGQASLEESPVINQTINVFSKIGDGSTSGYVIPWVAITEESLYITIDGIKQYNLSYTVSPVTTDNYTVVTFSAPIPQNAELEIVGFVTATPSQIRRFELIAGTMITEVTLPWAAPSENSLIVTIDGVKQYGNAYNLSYQLNGTTLLTFTSPLYNGMKIEVIGIQGFAATSFKKFEIAGNGLLAEYILPWFVENVQELIVSIDGVKQHTNDYSLVPIDSMSTTLILGDLLPLGAYLEVVGVTGLAENLINNTITGLNLGLGHGVYSSSGTSDGITTLEFKSLLAGPGISMASDSTTITISSNQVNLFSNVGIGAEILKTPIMSSVDFRTIIAGSGIDIIQNLDDLTISVSGNIDTFGGFTANDYVRNASSVGSGVGIVKKAVGSPDSNLEFYSLKAGNGIVVHRVHDEIYITDANGGNYISVIDDYTVERDDAIVGVSDTSLPRTIYLTDVASAAQGKVVTVKDESGNASVNPITVVGTSGQLIDDHQNVVIDSDYGSVTFYTDGNQWFVYNNNIEGNNLQTITVNNINSQTSTLNQVILSDGLGGAAWGDIPLVIPTGIVLADGTVPMNAPLVGNSGLALGDFSGQLLLNGTTISLNTGEEILLSSSIDNITFDVTSVNELIIRGQTLSLRDGANTQRLYVYNNYIDSSNYERLGVYFDNNGTMPYVCVSAQSLGAAVSQNIGISFVPKGVAGFTLAVPDQTTLGGNDRGQRAVDLQLERSSADQVASGNYSFVAGLGNKATGLYSFSVGRLCESTGTTGISIGAFTKATGSGTVSIGFDNTVSGVNAVGIGASNLVTGRSAVALGASNQPDGERSWVPGGGAAMVWLYGGWAWGSTNRDPDNVRDNFILGHTVQGTTVDDQPDVLTSTRTTVDADNVFRLLDNSAWAGNILILARDENGNAATWEIKILATRGVGPATTTILHSSVIDSFKSATLASTAVDVLVNATYGALVIQVTGILGTEIDWIAEQHGVFTFR